MISYNEQLILDELKISNPTAYEIIKREYDAHRENLKMGCHDIKNVIALLSGSYQLLALQNPDLSENTRFLQMGDTINELVNDMERISVLRYSDIVNAKDTSVSEIFSKLHTTLYMDYPEICSCFKFVRSCPDHIISCDADKFIAAVKELVKNAIEYTCQNAVEDKTITISLDTKKDADKIFLALSVTNCVNDISTDIMNRLGIPFAKSTEKHLHLGTAIVKSTANAHNGMTDFEIGDNQFTATILIPVAE